MPEKLEKWPKLLKITAKMYQFKKWKKYNLKQNHPNRTKNVQIDHQNKTQALVRLGFCERFGPNSEKNVIFFKKSLCKAPISEKLSKVQFRPLKMLNSAPKFGIPLKVLIVNPF